MQEIQVALGHGRAKNHLGIVVVYGIHDNLAVPMGSPGATFCNQPWDQLFQWSGITADDLWLPGEVSHTLSESWGKVVPTQKLAIHLGLINN